MLKNSSWRCILQTSSCIDICLAWLRYEEAAAQGLVAGANAAAPGAPRKRTVLYAATRQPRKSHIFACMQEG